MADLSKITGKFDLQKIINDVKSMISPVPIPEANKSDPVAYYLSELNKLAKDLAEVHTKQADLIAKVSNVLGNLYQEIMNARKGQAATPTPSTDPAKDPAAPKEEAEEAK